MARSKELVRLGVGRPALERIQWIHEAIAEGRYPNCRVLAEEHEVTQKTTQRDITFMQDRFGLPLHYDKPLFGYHYTADVSSFPVFEVGAGCRPQEIESRLVRHGAVPCLRVWDNYRG